MSIKEAFVFFLPLTLVLIAFFMSFVVYIMSGSNKQNKERFAHGKRMGRLTAENIGYAKAYKIADELPECAYKDGYVEGIAEVEDKWNK